FHDHPVGPTPMNRRVTAVSSRRDAVASPGSGAGAASLALSWWIAYAGVAVILLAILSSVAFLVAVNEQEMVKRHLLVFSQILANELSGRTGAVRSQLKRWRDDDGLRAALEEAGGDALRTRETELALMVPGVIGVRLLTAEDIEPGGAAGSRLSYAGVDMARQVKETGEIAALEAHRVNQDDEHLAIAGPIMDASGERPLGVVHLLLPLSLLPSAGDLSPQTAHFHFRQAADQRFVVINARNGEDPPGGAPAIEIPVDGTRLLLQAWGEPRGLFPGALMPWFGIITASALLSLALLLWLSYRHLLRRVEMGLAGLVALAEDAANRRPLRTKPNRIAEFKPVQETLQGILRDLTPARALQCYGEPKSAALADPLARGNDMTLGLDTGTDSGIDEVSSSKQMGATPKLAATAIQVAAATGPGHQDPVPQGPIEVWSGARFVPARIFRAYDIRGLVGSEITADLMGSLGMALGSEIRAQGGRVCIVGRDQRPSGESLSSALVEGLRYTGCDVVDLGIAPTPVLYYAAHSRDGCSAAMVTASHNPAEYNGLKVVLSGQSATGDQILTLRERMLRGDFTSGSGTYVQQSVFDDYVDAIKTDVAIARPLKIVIDCGHAAASVIAARLFRELDCEVLELDCDLDPGLADARMPDPSKPENLDALGSAVVGAEAALGLAFDADGDRLGVVDSAGRFIAVDRVLMLLAIDVLARLPGSDIVYDVKCTHHLGSEIVRFGGRPVMWRSGHSFIKEKMRELAAPLGGELTGHIVFSDRWNGFDDALYAGARLLEVLALDPRSSAEIFAEMPSAIGTPELFVPSPPAEARKVMTAVLGMAHKLDGVQVNTIDGLRAEFDHGWGLVRASNTQPGLVFRFQADDQPALEKIKELFRGMIAAAAPNLELPF
ncbi:MAG: phosphomannomutase/phosphoglucomutase, partial [Thiohalocapsa sp.]